MIRVTIELIPKGDESKKRHLGTIHIANDATLRGPYGNYNARFSRRGLPNSTWKIVSTWKFPRLRMHVYDLLFRLLHNAVGDRNKEWVENNPVH